MADTNGCKYSHVWKVNLDSTEVVHCQHSAVLVLVTKETVALGLPCLLVLNQVDVHYLTISVFKEVTEYRIYQFLCIMA